jgi:glucokinase
MAGGLGIARSYGAPTAADVVDAARGGDARATGVVRAAGAALGAAIAFAVNLVDPQAVVIGGGVGLNSDEYRAALERAMRSQIWHREARDVPLVDAELGPDAGVVGAACAALDHTRVGAA